MKYNLFLDDVRSVENTFNYMKDLRYLELDWVIVRNYAEFVAVIDEKGIPEIVSYDHDLAEIHYNPSTWTETFEYHEETGADCARYLISKMAKGSPHPEYIVHSMNPVGAEKIRNIIKDYDKYRNR